MQRLKENIYVKIIFIAGIANTFDYSASTNFLSYKEQSVNEDVRNSVLLTTPKEVVKYLLEYYHVEKGYQMLRYSIYFDHILSA